MNSYLIKLCFVCAFATNCFSVSQEKKTPEERKRLVLPKVMCSTRRIKAVFDALVNKNVHVKDPTGAVIPVRKSEEFCGVKLSTDKNQSLVFLSKYDSCFTRFKDRRVVIPLHVQLIGEDDWYRVNISCPLVKRSSEKKPRFPTISRECTTPKALRIDCGYRNISSEVCIEHGCCFDYHDKTCYYRLNSCSLDGHFVFSVSAADTDSPIYPSRLIVKDQPHCLPVLTTSDTAVFKVGLKECGTKMKEDGDRVIYEVEVEDGRDSLFSLQVACEYKPSELKKAAEWGSLLTVTNPPPAIAMGSIEVQMRIARDSSFTSFFAEDELPVILPLREVAYVEIALVQPSPDPTLSLSVRDCLAYPLTKHSVWSLLYDGCPNPLDDMQSSIPVDNKGNIAFHSQIRRFNVKTFAFLDPHTGHPSQEQVFFYCWVEICTKNIACAQYCSFTSSEGERQRRETLFIPNEFQLVSLGPLLLGQNGTNVEENPCLRSEKMFQITLYVLSGVGAALLLVVLSMAWRGIRRCQKQQVEAQDV